MSDCLTVVAPELQGWVFTVIMSMATAWSMQDLLAPVCLSLLVFVNDEQPVQHVCRHDYDALTARDRVNLDIFWLRDESLEETANLPEPDALAAEIVDDLEAALEQFRAIAEDLGEEEIAPQAG